MAIGEAARESGVSAKNGGLLRERRACADRDTNGRRLPDRSDARDRNPAVEPACPILRHLEAGGGRLPVAARQS